MQKLEQAYEQYLATHSNVNDVLSKSEFLEKLKNDDDFNKKFGKKITRPMALDERLEIAYPDKEERMVTLVYMGTRQMKILLNKLKIPKRKIMRSASEIESFLSNDNVEIIMK